MAIQFSKHKYIPLEEIVANFPNDLSNGTSPDKLLEALGHYDVLSETIEAGDMNNVTAAITQGHIVLVSINLDTFAERGADWGEGSTESWEDSHWNRYYDYGGGHWLVVKGIVQDPDWEANPDQLWVVTYDPNVFPGVFTRDSRYWYKNGEPKGKERYYSYAEFENAFHATAIEIINEEQLDQNELSQGLIAYYPFDGNANDMSGNQYHGISRGAILTSDRFGNLESAYRFDGENDLIALPKNLDLIDTDFTISAWISPTSYGKLSPTSNSCVSMIVAYRHRSHANGSPRNSGLHFSLSRDNGCGDNSYLSTSFKDSNYLYNGIGYKYDKHDWFLYTVTRDSEEMALYINGIEFNRKEVSGEVVYENPMHIGTMIGANYRDGRYFFPFEGDIDEVRIYNRALSVSEVCALYSQ